MENIENYESFANIFENVKQENYKMYNGLFEGKTQKSKILEIFDKMLENYLTKIISVKNRNIIDVENNIKKFAKCIVQHITGDYEIGIGEADFEELTSHSETISNIVAYSEDKELSNLLNKENEQLAIGISSGIVSNSFISSKNEEIAKKMFDLSNIEIKKFFKNSINNILNINKIFANGIAHLTGIDKEESKELNSNILGKTIGGIGYELLSGTLISKRNFTDVINSPSMQEKIKNEGLLHFTSPTNASKIIESQNIKPSSFLESDLTKKKSFFFAGTPTFEDLLINIPAYDVMTAVRIHPTENQMHDLKYRALNDRAVVKDGEFTFDKEQAEIAYFGLMYDKEKNNIYLGELTEEQAKDFKVSDEVRKAYSYDAKKSSLLDNIKLNAYGFYAEYKHHQKLLQMERILKEKGINSFRDVNDATLVELADIEQAYINTKDDSVKRRNLFLTIKESLILDKKQERSEIEDDRLL